MLGFFCLTWLLGTLGASTCVRRSGFSWRACRALRWRCPPPAVMAADLSPPREREVPHTWTFWLEGGAPGAAGNDAALAGLIPGFATPNNKWGWNGAFGLDYQIDAVWHASADFRYGRNRTRSQAAARWRSLGFPVLLLFTSFPRSHSRHHIRRPATKQIGRPISWSVATLGSAPTIRNSSWSARGGYPRGNRRHRRPPGAVFMTRLSWQLPTLTKRRVPANQPLLWFGPRLAVEGSAPFAGGWSVDYMGGVAGLYAIDRSGEQTVVMSTIGPLVCSLSPLDLPRGLPGGHDF